MHGCLHHPHGIHAARSEDLAAEERILSSRRNAFVIAVIFINMYVIVITEHATVYADYEAAVFAKDDIEDDDDWKTGPRFFKKE